MGSFKNPKCLAKMCITSGCCFQHFPKTMNIFEKHFGFIEIPFFYLNLFEFALVLGFETFPISNSFET